MADDTQQIRTGPRRSLDGLFAAMRGLGVQRSSTDRWLAGVCSGLANRFGVDPLLARGILIVLIFMGGIGILAYLVAWALLPDQHGRILAEDGLRGNGHGIALLVVIGIVLISRLGNLWWLWLILVPVGVLAWWGVQSTRSGKTPEQMSEEATQFANRIAATFSGSSRPAQPSSYAGAPGAPTGAPVAAPHGMGPGRTGTVVAPERVIRHRRRRGGLLALLVTAGLAVAAYGIGQAVASGAGLAGDRQLVAAGFAVAGAGLALVLIGLAGRRAGFTVFLVILATMFTVAGTAAPPLPPGGVGERAWSATSQPAGGFSLTAGDAKLDLAGAPDNTSVRVAIGFGQLRVTVPKGTTATFSTAIEAGQVVVMHADGTKTKLDRGNVGTQEPVVAGTGPTQIKIDTHLFAGEIVITEEG